MLLNYERRTGEVLKREDLQDNVLASKLIPSDYDIKNQVLSFGQYVIIFL